MAIPLFKDILDSQNVRLTKDVTMEEVWQLVKQIGSFKAPDPDDVDAIFIRNVEILQVSLSLIQIEFFFIMHTY